MNRDQIENHRREFEKQVNERNAGALGTRFASGASGAIKNRN